LTYSHISSPLWSLYSLLGFEGMMVLLAENPGLAAYACQRLLTNMREDIRLIAALGAEAVWIEECLTDQVHPTLFRQLNLPILRQIVEEIRAQNMKSIYYYCGDPWKRMDTILEAGADAIHFEESKKGFKIDIEDVVEAVQGKCVVFGNLDAIGVLQNSSETQLRAEIERQIQAGRRNSSRFVMSTGSPITPGTPVERVHLYAELVKKIGG
jgi:uroporphyrinogen-III decarboxylase